MRLFAKGISMRILKYADLRAKGVCGSRASLHRLRDTDPTFPQGVAIGGGIGWLEAEVDGWIAARPRIEKRPQVSTINGNRLARATA